MTLTPLYITVVKGDFFNFFTEIIGHNGIAPLDTDQLQKPHPLKQMKQVVRIQVSAEWRYSVMMSGHRKPSKWKYQPQWYNNIQW